MKKQVYAPTKPEVLTHNTRMAQLIEITKTSKIFARIKYLGERTGSSGYSNEFIEDELKVTVEEGYYVLVHKAFGPEPLKISAAQEKKNPSDFLIIIDYPSVRITPIREVKAQSPKKKKSRDHVQA